MRASYSIVTDANEAFAGGAPIVVYAVQMVSTGGDHILLYDGDPTETDNMITHSFTPDSTTLDFECGLVFPNGCWAASPGDTRIVAIYEKL